VSVLALPRAGFFLFLYAVPHRFFPQCDGSSLFSLPPQFFLKLLLEPVSLARSFSWTPYCPCNRFPFSFSHRTMSEQVDFCRRRPFPPFELLPLPLPLLAYLPLLESETFHPLSRDFFIRCRPFPPPLVTEPSPVFEGAPCRLFVAPFALFCQQDPPGFPFF